MSLPNPGMTIDPSRTALVITDLQNDFLSPSGRAWGMLVESLERNNVLENLETLLQTAKAHGLTVIVSPHYCDTTDHQWQAPPGALEALIDQLGLFHRAGPLALDGFTGSGADWPERFRPYIDDGKTVIASPHKVYGTSSNDLILQLRKRRIEKVIVAGAVANLCVEGHLRDFLEHAFEVAVVRDAVGGLNNEEGQGHDAAMVNFRFMAHALWTTRQTVEAIEAGTASTRHAEVLA